MTPAADKSNVATSSATTTSNNGGGVSEERIGKFLASTGKTAKEFFRIARKLLFGLIQKQRQDHSIIMAHI